MRYLLLIPLLIGQPAFGGIDPESQNLIDLGFANGLREVNDKGLPDDPRFRDKTGLSYSAPKGGWVPNPTFYPLRNPASVPAFFYRTVRECMSKEIISEQLIFTYNGYQNYVGGSRYQQQCIDDGSFDTFYEESAERQG